MARLLLLLLLVVAGCNAGPCEWEPIAFEVTEEMLPTGMLEDDCIGLVAPAGTGFYDVAAFTCNDEDLFECVLVHPSRVSEIGFFRFDGSAHRPMLVPRSVECKRYECADLRNMITNSQ